MISVIVPAHDEANVIRRCVSALVDGCAEGELEVIVVCNGCRDVTAEVARGAPGPVRVIETEVASKAHALRLGDAAAQGFPRFYVDADVVLPLPALRRVAAALRSGTCKAAAPRLAVDLRDRSWTVRAFYEIWTRLPYHRSGMIGSGVYALSREGRARFETFPDIVADDEYVRLQFSPDERRTLDDVCFTIVPPTTLAGVIHIKTRSQKGGVQLRRLHPELQRNDDKRYGRPLLEFSSHPRFWPMCVVYAFVMAVAKARAHWANRIGDLGVWERDESSRVDLTN